MIDNNIEYDNIYFVTHYEALATVVQVAFHVFCLPCNCFWMYHCQMSARIGECDAHKHYYAYQSTRASLLRTDYEELFVVLSLL